MDLVPGNPEGHHNIGDRMGLREEVADLCQGIDVPSRHLVLPHSFLPTGFKAAFFHLALPDGLHNLEAHLRVQTLGNQIEHDIVPAAYRLQNAGRPIEDQFPRVALPDVGAVGEA